MISRSKVSFFLIIFVALICCSAVSATDANNSVEDIGKSTHTGITTQDTDMIEDIEEVDESQKNIESTTKSSAEKTDKTIQKKTTDTNTKTENSSEVYNYRDLRLAVSLAELGGIDTTIPLHEGTYDNIGTIEWNTQGLVLTIDGNGQTINGRGQRVFKVSSGATLILKNITITNATADDGGAILNYGTLTVTGSTFQNNTVDDDGGAIYNYGGTLTVTGSTFHNNTANGEGGAIYDSSLDILSSISFSNFTYNTANSGAAIFAHGWTNLTGNTFKENRANSNKETIYLYGYWNGLFDGNVYESTDVSLSEISLSIKGGESTYSNGVDVVLNFTIRPTNGNYYWDFEEGISDITVYVNGEKIVTTGYENYTLTGLKPGEYEVYFTSCNQQSNTVTFIVVKNSQITTPETIYEYYAGINDKIPFTITDGGEKGTITLTVKEGDEYKKLSTAYNVGEQYSLSTEALAELLESVYDELDSSYIINVTYDTDDVFVSPSSTEFTLNINKQRNTSIVYDIINNTEENVQINITVIDQIYNTPIQDAQIQITGDITQNTTTGIITDNTLTPGSYTINIKYNEINNYKSSETTINFNVEIDKDKQIQELEDELNEANTQIENLTNTIENLTNIIENLNKAKETTIIIDPLENIKYGDEITITGLLVNEDYLSLSNQEVTIVFNDEEVTVKTRSDEFKYTTTANVLGENTITATFAGNDKYQESTATYTFEVAKADTTITIEDIIAVKKGETVTITGTLTDHNGNTLANKVIRLLINNGRKTLKTDADGVYSFDYALTKVGENTITATFEGDDYYTESTETVTVEALALSSVITIDPVDTIVKGTKATFTGTLMDENGEAIANAQVKLNINGNTKTLKTDSEGRFTHTFTMNTVGENTITATYAGSTNYEAAQTQTKVKVKDEAIITLDPIETITKGDNATFTGKLTDKDGKAIANAQVRIIINGSPKTLRTDENGVFTHTFKMIKEGTNNITVVFNGNNYYLASETSSTVEVVKAE